MTRPQPIRITTPDEEAQWAPVWADVEAFEKIITRIRETFLERDEMLDVISLGLIGGVNGSVIGPPGTGKSKILETLSMAVEGFRFYYGRGTPCMTPEYVFGPISVAGLKDDDFRLANKVLPAPRAWAHQAHLALFDEGSRMPKEIWDSMLSLLEEHEVTVGSNVYKAPLLFGMVATNEDLSEMQAAFDRFALRCECRYVADLDSRMQLHRFYSGYGTANEKLRDARPRPIALDAIMRMRAAARQVEVPDDVLLAADEVQTDLKRRGIELSDRRCFPQTWAIVRASAILNRRKVASVDDLAPLALSYWTTQEQKLEVRQIVGTKAATIAFELESLYAQALSEGEKALRALNANPPKTTQELSKIGIDAATALTVLGRKISALKQGQNGKAINPADEVRVAATATKVDRLLVEVKKNLIK